MDSPASRRCKQITVISATNNGYFVRSLTRISVASVSSMRCGGGLGRGGLGGCTCKTRFIEGERKCELIFE